MPDVVAPLPKNPPETPAKRPSGLYRTLDEALDGKLAEELRKLYDGNWERVAARIFAKHHVHVTGETLRRWARDLGIDTSEAAS